MKKILIVLSLLQTLALCAKDYFDKYPECYIGAQVYINSGCGNGYQHHYEDFYRIFENGKLSKGFPKDKGFEEYSSLIYTITAMTDGVVRKEKIGKVLTLQSGDKMLYYFTNRSYIYTDFHVKSMPECQRYIEDSIRATQLKVEKRIAKNDDPFLGTTTYRLTTALDGIDYSSMQNGYISMSKSYKGNEFVCYIVDISLPHVLDEVGPKGLHIIWDNGEHFIKEELPIEKDVVRYTGVGNYFMYSYTAQLVLSAEEYNVFCNNSISRVRLGSGIDYTGVFQKNGDFYKYCFNALKAK